MDDQPEYDSTRPRSAIDFHEELARAWDQKYRQPSFKRRAQAVIELLNNCDLTGQLWLDAGCGSGYLSRRLMERGCGVIGVDGSQAMVDVAQGLVEEPHRTKSLFCRITTVECLPLRSAAFDGVICSSVLEYLNDPRACLQQLYRVMKPGSLLIISVPHSRSLLRRSLKLAYQLTARLLRKPWPTYIQYSVNEYDISALVGLLHNHGFRVEKVNCFSPIGQSAFARSLLSSLIVAVARRPPNPL